MLKKDILWIAVGEAGGRIVNEILKKDKRYVGLFLNSNFNDLKDLENAKNVYTMANSSGTGKNRTKSKLLFSENRHSIYDEILKFHSAQVYHIVFSMGGGTGGGLVPSLIMGMKLMNIHKPINVTCVLPSYSDNKRYRKNAIECWNELTQLDNINAIHLLDNSKRDNKEQINKEYAEMFDVFMNMPKFDAAEDSTVDAEEIGIIGLCKGSTVFYNLPKGEKNAKMGLAKAIQNSIFADLCEENEACQYLAITTKPNEYDQKDIENLFNVNEYSVNSFNDNHNLVVASGFKPQRTIIEMLDTSLKEEIINKNTLPIETFSDLKIETDIVTKQTTDSKNSHQKNVEIVNNDIDKLLDDEDLWSKAFDM